MNDHRLGKTMYFLLIELKTEFRRWYSMLSVEEIMTNSDLIRAVEKVEKSLTEAISQAEALR